MMRIAGSLTLAGRRRRRRSARRRRTGAAPRAFLREDQTPCGTQELLDQEAGGGRGDEAGDRDQHRAHVIDRARRRRCLLRTARPALPRAAGTACRRCAGVPRHSSAASHRRRRFGRSRRTVGEDREAGLIRARCASRRPRPSRDRNARRASDRTCRRPIARGRGRGARRVRDRASP